MRRSRVWIGVQTERGWASDPLSDDWPYEEHQRLVAEFEPGPILGRLERLGGKRRAPAPTAPVDSRGATGEGYSRAKVRWVGRLERGINRARTRAGLDFEVRREGRSGRHVKVGSAGSFEEAATMADGCDGFVHSHNEGRDVYHSDGFLARRRPVREYASEEWIYDYREIP